MGKRFTYSSETETEALVETKVKASVNYAIVIYNDDVNTFDFVIDSLIKICKHNSVQAEQCTYLIHYSGRCAVKTGSFDELKSICETLQNVGLSATIE